MVTAQCDKENRMITSGTPSSDTPMERSSGGLAPPPGSDEAPVATTIPEPGPVDSGTMDIRATELRPSPDALSATELIDASELEGYRIVKKIGRGGCSTVYEAAVGDSERRVAVKILRQGLAGSRRQVLRFIQEAHAVQRIDHSCIVPIHETGYLTDGRPFLVMELVQGQSLTQILHASGRMTPEEALLVLEPVCEGLARAHEAGIVHRDIKASNIMVSGPVDDPVVRLLDFGIAKLLTAEDNESLDTSMGRVVGTPHSMAPEQILGHPVTGRTDVYALGVLLFRMLTGRHPYVSPDPQVIVQMHMTASPPKPSEFAPLDRAVDEVIARAMAKDPEHRYRNPRMLVAALRQAIRADIAGVQVTAAAVALYVDARLPEESELDDQVLDELMMALDDAELELREQGYVMALQTSSAVLAVRVLDPDADQATLTSEVLAAVATAEALLPRMRELTGASVHFNVCVHTSDALVESGIGGRDALGGPILDIGTWAPLPPQDGVWRSPTVRALGIAE